MSLGRSRWGPESRGGESGSSPSDPACEERFERSDAEEFEIDRLGDGTGLVTSMIDVPPTMRVDGRHGPTNWVTSRSPYQLRASHAYYRNVPYKDEPIRPRRGNAHSHRRSGQSFRRDAELSDSQAAQLPMARPVHEKMARTHGNITAADRDDLKSSSTFMRSDAFGAGGIAPAPRRDPLEGREQATLWRQRRRNGLVCLV